MKIIFWGNPSDAYFEFVKTVFSECEDSSGDQENILYTTNPNQNPQPMLHNLAMKPHSYDGIVIPGYDAVTGDDVTYVYKYRKVPKTKNVQFVHKEVYQWFETHWELIEVEDFSSADILIGMINQRRSTLKPDEYVGKHYSS